ncbi:MAG: sensor histidine kinase [Chloroflexi bacterium]|nr:sensor histidine kinase [Chloroflexota bacterium]
MFRTLRQRLVWSQILPLLLILPLMGVLLVYSLEGQVLIPQLAKNLVGNARLLAEISNAEFELWGDPILFENLISRVQLSSDIQVMFLDGRGKILYSSNPSDPSQTATGVSPTGLSRALGGHEAALTNYSILNLSNVVVDVYEPVIDAGGRVIGIVRLSYRLGSLYDIFEQLRGQILWALGLGLILSIVLGTWLAFSISRPVREVTDAIYNLAAGQRSEPVQEYGPQELRSQARAVNFLVDELHSMEASRRQLLANVVHELGRPLGALRSAIHSLRKGAASDPALLEDLTRGMDEETLRLEYVLNELANLYDKARGPLELNRQPVEMADWLRGVLSPWKSAAEEKHLLWRDQLPVSLPTLSIDGMRMAEVVGNLLSNAVKYTPAGGTVTISAGADDTSFWLTVADTGVGILPDEREKIFQPFYRGETGRRIKQGMGLGLTIAREIVLAHGGELRVESEPGQGGAFTLSLPLGS